MTRAQRIYKALRKTTILSKHDCRYAAIKLAVIKLDVNKTN